MVGARVHIWTSPLPGRDVIFEFRRIGRSVKVTAVDSLTLTEVSVVCPANAAETTLRAAALRKLEFVLKRRRGDGQARS